MKEQKGYVFVDRFERSMSGVYPQRHKSWEAYIRKQETSGASIAVLENAIEAMKALNEGKSFNKVYEIINNQHHDGFSEAIVMDTLLRYAKRGPKFYQAVFSEEMLSPETMEYVKYQEKQNEKYEKAERRRVQAELRREKISRERITQ